MESVSRWHRSLRARGIRYLEVALPHRGELEAGSLSPEDAVDVYWRSLIADPPAISRRGASVLARFGVSGASTPPSAAVGAENPVLLEISGPGTALGLAIDPARAFLNDGVLSDSDLAAGRTFDSLPAGTLSFIPVPLTVSGTFTADYTFTGGQHYPKVRLVLREGRIVEIDAEDDGSGLRERLTAAAGDANLISELAIGLNPAGSGPLAGTPGRARPAGFTGKPVLDSCLTGRVTLGFGNNELLGGDVRSTLNLILPAAALTMRAGGVEIVKNGILSGDEAP
jgi:hypothetical protein